MEDNPPEPPTLGTDDVLSLITWLESCADWLREDQAVAARFGHGESEEFAANMRLYEGAALLLREAYEVDLPDQ